MEGTVDMRQNEIRKICISALYVDISGGEAADWGMFRIRRFRFL